MIRSTVLLFIIVVTTVTASWAKSENADIRRGNREFRSENFSEAELNYRQALEQNPRNTKALYNLANALYKLGRYEEAANILEGLSASEMPESTRADVYHNLGNARVGAQNIAEAVDAYKNSLRIRPEDDDTRHNLAWARRLLQEQEQQQQDQQDQQDDQDQDQQPDSGDEDQPQDQQQQPRQRPDQISPQDAERILDALNQQEQEIQQKIEREERQRQPIRPERQW